MLRDETVMWSLALTKVRMCVCLRVTDPMVCSLDADSPINTPVLPCTLEFYHAHYQQVKKALYVTSVSPANFNWTNYYAPEQNYRINVGNVSAFKKIVMVIMIILMHSQEMFFMFDLIPSLCLLTVLQNVLLPSGFRSDYQQRNLQSWRLSDTRPEEWWRGGWRGPQEGLHWAGLRDHSLQRPHCSGEECIVESLKT